MASVHVVPAVLSAGSVRSGWAGEVVTFPVRRVLALGLVASRLVGRLGIGAPRHDGSSQALVDQ
jgi:hypothetical protein